MSNDVAPTGLISIESILDGLSGLVTGIPDCRPSFDITTPESIGVFPSVPTELELVVSNVRCGLTHATLTLDNIPTGYYTVEPEFYPALYPGKLQSYKITFDIPSDTSGRVFITRPVISDNSQNYYSNEFEIHVAEKPEKPAVATGPVIENLETSTAKPTSVLNSKTWWAVGIVSVVAAIFLVIYEYVPHKSKKSQRRKL